MQDEKVMSVEQIDKHVETTYTPKKAGAEKDSATFNLCATYAVARPIIIFAKSFLFFKPKWQDAVGKFVTALDAVCRTNS